MTFSHTHDIAKYSTLVVLSDVIRISKWRSAAILDLEKIAIISPAVEGFGSHFVGNYKITL